MEARFIDSWTLPLLEAPSPKMATLRFFTGRLEPTSDWPRKLVDAYKKDFGEDQ